MKERVWAISDTHFWHHNIIKYCERPFINVEQMNTQMVLSWNEHVKKNDLVFHLGDVSFGDAEQTIDILSQLNGRLVLIAGNHDRHTKWKKKDPTLLNRFFLEIVDYKRYNHYGLKFVLCHFPFASWERNYINLHGHTHGKYKDQNRQLDVGVDVIGYAPILLDEAYSLAHNGGSTKVEI